MSLPEPQPSPPPSPADALRGAVAGLLRQQMEDGRFEGEVVWCAMLPAQYVLACHITGTRIDDARRRRILRQLEVTREPNGTWSLYQGGPSYLFVTTLAYVAARLLGTPANHPLLTRAGVFIRREGVTNIPSWGKFWLAMVDLYPWDAVPPITPELWSLPRDVPAHPFNYYCHTRLIYVAMAALYTQRVTAATPNHELRAELYPQGYAETALPAPGLRAEEVCAPPSALLRTWYHAAHALERGVARTGRVGAAWRKRLLARLHDEICFDVRITGGACISPVNGLLSWISLWAAGDAAAQTVAAGVERWFWEDDIHGTRIAGAKSEAWDTAFALQALAAAKEALGPQWPDDGDEGVARATTYLLEQQCAAPREPYEAHGRINPQGGIGFSGLWHGWPVSDCTAEALLGLAAWDWTRAPAARVREAVAFILRCQNHDGGFGSYEPKKSRVGLEWINPAEMFGSSMTEGSYTECTASCVAALHAALASGITDLPAGQMHTAIERGVGLLRRRQTASGAWEGVWGVGFIYGTLFAIAGLRGAGVPATDPGVRLGARWLLRTQNPDGGFGEHAQSCLTGQFVPDASHPVQTAWAMLALLESEHPAWGALERAARWLVQHQRQDGLWDDPRGTGIFFRTAVLDYRLYRAYFPTWALACYGTRLRQRLSTTPSP